MSFLNDREIRDLALNQNMITDYIPNVESKIGNIRVPSFGTSSFGYDVRLAREIKAFHPLHNGIADPMDFNPKINLMDLNVEDELYYTIPAKGYILGCTMESFNIPEDTMVICIGKSTYARCGIFINVTPIEPGFRGQVTLEIYNASSNPVKLYLEAGICQFMFTRGNRPEVTYADRAGKYQDQLGVTTARG